MCKSFGACVLPMQLQERSLFWCWWLDLGIFGNYAEFGVDELVAGRELSCVASTCSGVQESKFYCVQERSDLCFVSAANVPFNVASRIPFIHSFIHF